MPTMNTETRTVGKVHAWPRALVVAALLTCTLAAGWVYLTQGVTSRFWAAWVPVVLTAVPLFLRRRRPFNYACAAVGVLLLALAAQGALLWFLPAALILLATTADPRRSPWRARLSVLIGTSLAVVPIVASAGAIHRSLTSPPAGLVVHTDASSTTTGSALEQIISGADVRGSSMTTKRADGSDGPTTIVEFQPGLSQDGQERLRRSLTEAPGVSKVCSWYRDNHLRSAC